MAIKGDYKLQVPNQYVGNGKWLLYEHLRFRKPYYIEKLCLSRNTSSRRGRAIQTTYKKFFNYVYRIVSMKSLWAPLRLYRCRYNNIISAIIL